MKTYMPECFNFDYWYKKSVTVTDYGRILYLIQDSLGNTMAPPDILHHLYLMISASKKYLSSEVPGNVVTMNSEVILRHDHNREQKIRIVYPENIHTPQDVSIYSPLGAACLGATEKSYIYYHDPSGHNRAFIQQIVFQPEKEKLFNL
ncbi:MAG: GreA/GreB family elongation factor [Bacteroidales bacterium]|nr:GreA/GreB family elongation factor [Bacteroidales bacterium]